MARGEPIWQTSSTGPTSMPSSSEAVATRRAQVAGAQPGLDDAPAGRRQAAVVGGDQQRGVDVTAAATGLVLGQALGQAGGPPARPSSGC